MDNDALVAALGRDADAAVRGYRAQVITEAWWRGLRLRAQTRPDADPIDIRLSFQYCVGRADLAGRTLRWSAAHGWSSSHVVANAPLSFYAGSPAAPLLLVPHAWEVVAWAGGECEGPATPPLGVDLDEDPRAIRRLIECIPHGEDGMAPELDTRSG